MPGQPTAGNHVYAAAGTFASKHDLAQQLAAAGMRWGRRPLSRIVHHTNLLEPDHRQMVNTSHHTERNERHDRNELHPGAASRARPGHT
jgi:hypothetical protein